MARVYRRARLFRGRASCKDGPMPRLRAPTALLLLALLPACVGGTGRRDVGSWMEARGADFMDMLGVRVAVGVGLGAYVRATEWLQLGFMRRGPLDTSLVGGSGSVREDSFQVRAVPCAMFGTIGRYGGLWTETSREFMLPGYSNRDDVVSPIHREIVAGVVSVDGRGDDWQYSFGAGVHAVILGVEAEVRPLQIFDFFAGLLGYDPSGDDVPVLESGESPRPAAES
jgi:hypothetical protein